MTTKNKVSLLQLNDNSIQSNTNSIQSNTHLVFSNQDYRKIFASNVPSSRFEYIENKGVAIKGRVNGAILETKVPIHENKKYHLICEVELLEDDGSGSTIFIGHDTLDKNFKSLRTDTAVTFNYSLADKIHLSDDEPNRTFETVVSGFNSTDDGNNYKFDPSGSYFNIVFYTRDEETDISSVKLLIKRLEIKEFSSIIERDNGNVGVGIINPNTKLDISGALNATTIYENETLLTDKYASKEQVTINTQDISDNRKDISDNRQYILKNIQDISDNREDISDNRQYILKNIQDISDNRQNISANTQSILANTNKISDNTTAIETNSSNITENTNKISDNTTAHYIK